MPLSDPILVEVIHNYLLSAAREMQRNLIRTSYSTIIYEIHDFGLGIYDDQCNLLAEAPGLAVFTRGNDYGLRKVVEFLGEDNLHPGDLILLNYPYWSSAHILDVLAVSPIFHEEELMGFHRREAALAGSGPEGSGLLPGHDGRPSGRPDPPLQQNLRAGRPEPPSAQSHPLQHAHARSGHRGHARPNLLLPHRGTTGTGPGGAFRH